MSSSNTALPPRGRPDEARTDAEPALDGEVIPPFIRAIPSSKYAEAAAATTESRFPFRLGTAVLVSGLTLALAAGGVATYHWRAHLMPGSGPGPTALALAHLAKDVGDLKTAVEAGRQDDGVRALKKSVDVLKAELDALRNSNATAVAQLAAKLDHPAPVSTTPEILARLDKIDHDPRMTDIAGRLDRIERQISVPEPTGSIAAPARSAQPQTFVPQTVTAAGKPPKPAVLDNWIVRDVYSGIALVEGRTGSIREVVPGETLPGAGQVQAIERRGRSWVVVTSRGIIDTATW